MVLAVSLIHRK